MNRLELQSAQSVIETGDSAPIEAVAESTPGSRAVVAEVAPIDENMTLVGFETEMKAALGDIALTMEILEAAGGIAEGYIH
jgi:hypothetical protein